MDCKKQTNYKTKVEIHFYATPYYQLIRHLDWRGILLKAHINWLNQVRTHCAIRVLTDDLDMTYQATWSGLLSSKTSDIKYVPIDIVDITHKIDVVIFLDNIKHLFKHNRLDRIHLNELLKLMRGKPEEVSRMLCTSFIGDALGHTIVADALYPDNLYNRLMEWTNA